LSFVKEFHLCYVSKFMNTFINNNSKLIYVMFQEPQNIKMSSKFWKRIVFLLNSSSFSELLLNSVVTWGWMCVSREQCSTFTVCNHHPLCMFLTKLHAFLNSHQMEVSG